MRCWSVIVHPGQCRCALNCASAAWIVLICFESGFGSAVALDHLFFFIVGLLFGRHTPRRVGVVCCSVPKVVVIIALTPTSVISVAVIAPVPIPSIMTIVVTRRARGGRRARSYRLTEQGRYVMESSASRGGRSSEGAIHKAQQPVRDKDSTELGLLGEVILRGQELNSDQVRDVWCSK
ncbi:hypothetical protein Cgig2_000368 [Carnegiea gigantea]|uniref:Uncharacterized protein n=1 Tax=Carnegiea gigantea TaxID=171969 RepID=A0A9Q1K3R5_9CARY|nr:hypothetical protein Cgig2_000368 [Carnegiea gigantea]